MGNEPVVLKDNQIGNIINRVVELFCKDVLARKNTESKVLSDDSEIPNEELIFSIIGDKDLILQQTMSYIYDNNNDISEAWKYYIRWKNLVIQDYEKEKDDILDQDPG